MNHRPSILHRPLKPTLISANTENLDKEYTEEQEYWSLKARRKADAEERLRRSLYAAPEDVLRNKEETLAVISLCESEKKAELDRLKQRDQHWFNVPAWKGDPDVLTATLRPWTVATNSLSADDAVEARRRHVSEVDRENRRMIDAKAARERHQLDVERVQASREIQSEDVWWNLGAASEKWIPPERRVKGRGTQAPALGQSQVQLAWNEDSHLGFERGTIAATTSKAAEDREREGLGPQANVGANPTGPLPRTSTAPYDWPQQPEDPRPVSGAGVGPNLYPWSWDAEPLAETPRLGHFKTVLR